MLGVDALVPLLQELVRLHDEPVEVFTVLLGLDAFTELVHSLSFFGGHAGRMSRRTAPLPISSA